MAAVLASLFSMAVTQFTSADKATYQIGVGSQKSAELQLPLSEPTDEWLLQEDLSNSGDQACMSSGPYFSSFNVHDMVPLAIPSLTELPTPVPDLLVLLVAFASFAISCRLRRFWTGSMSQKPPASAAERNEATDSFGCTQLHLVADAGSLAEARKLLAEGADPNAREAWDETPLHMASRAGHLELSKLLVIHGANINACNADDETPLVLAARAGKNDVCNFLLEVGANTGGLEEEKLPCLLNNLLLQRMFVAAGADKVEATSVADKRSACR
mmetsp:Transcript_43694/g.81489  ORF Transcript_43694/g.81489 Transcript_43694/m.81489 type:complete len:272 (+) Transcript_43694:199-1014(+)